MQVEDKDLSIPQLLEELTVAGADRANQIAEEIMRRHNETSKEMQALYQFISTN